MTIWKLPFVIFSKQLKNGTDRLDQEGIALKAVLEEVNRTLSIKVKWNWSNHRHHLRISDRLRCEHWLQLLINFRSDIAKLSANHVSRFLIFKEKRNSNRIVRWCLNWVCRMWRRLIAESMSLERKSIINCSQCSQEKRSLINWKS